MNAHPFKRKLFLTTALTAAMAGLPFDKALADCLIDGAAPNYLCENASTNQWISENNANVVTAPGFSATVALPGSPALYIAGSGAISFTDAYASALTAKGSAIQISSTGDDGATPGSIYISSTGALTSSDAYGIHARNSGTGTMVISAMGDIVSYNDAINAQTSGAGMSITTGNLSGWKGITAVNNGATGAVDVLVMGDIAANHAGLSIHNNNGANIDDMTIEVLGKITSTTYRGIDARQLGLGNLSITVDGDVSSAQHGVMGRNAASTTGDITIHTKGKVETSAGMGGAAISVLNNGSGKATVTTEGDINGDGTGIDVISNNQAKGVTIRAVNVAGTGVLGVGIRVQNSGGVIDIATTGDVTGGATGVSVYSNSATDVLLDVHNVKGNMTGVSAWASNGNVDLDATTGTIEGFNGVNLGTTAGDITAKIANIVTSGIQPYTGYGFAAYVGGGGTLAAEIGNITANTGIGIGVRIGYSAVAETIVTGDVFASQLGARLRTYDVSSSQLTIASGAAMIADKGVEVYSYSYGTGVTIIDVSGRIEGTGGIAIAAVAGYAPAGQTKINIRSGSRIVGDVVQGVGYIAQQRADYCNAYPASCYAPFVPTVGDARVSVLGDFTTEGNFDVTTFDVSKGSTLTISNNNNIVVSGGPVDVAGTLRVIGASGITGGLSNGGTLSLESGGHLSVDTMAAATGNIVVGVTSAAQHGLLTITGAPAQMNGQTVSVFVPAVNSLQNGDQILVIDGTGTVIDGPNAKGVSVTSNNPVWEFMLRSGAGITDDSDLFLSVSKAAPAPQIEVDGAIVAATLTFADTALNLTGERLSTLRSGHERGVSAGNTGGARVWVQALGQHTDQKLRKGVAGYEANLFGGTIGVDTDKYLKDGVVGLAFSYGRSNIDSEDRFDSHTKINSYQLTVYSDYNWAGGTYVEGQLAYGYNRNDKTRYNAGGAGLDAKSDFDSHNVALRGEAGQTYNAGSAFVTPFALASWLYYTADDYTETGAGAGNLHVKSKNMNQIDLGLGLKTGMTFETVDHGIVIPTLHAVYRRDMLGDSLSTTQGYVAGGGPVMTVDSPDPARNKLTLGARVKYYSEGGFELTGAYDFDVKQDFTGHTGYVRAGWQF